VKPISHHLTILNGGVFTTVQDRGRYGYTHLGITTSGAIDQYAYHWSQRLLGQRINALEVMVGLVLEVGASVEIAVTGADLDFCINGEPRGIWQTHWVRRGDILSFKRRRLGQRAYLAVRGGFDVPYLYGSYATTIKEGIGRRLVRGDRVAFRAIFHPNGEVRRVQSRYIPEYPTSLRLRLVLGYQSDYFDAQAKADFFETTYHLPPQSDRMGYKLKGRAVVPLHDGMVSEGIAYGAVQIPKDGQPIVLLNERQTIGGYPKIGSVVPMDCYALGQLPLDGCVKFEPISWEEAQKIVIS